MRTDDSRPCTCGSTLLRGGCHCGAVRFEVDLAPDAAHERCACAICRKVGGYDVYVSADAFELLTGMDFLRDYRFASKAVVHYFCGRCGVHPFCRARSEEDDDFGINLACLDDHVTVAAQQSAA